MSIRPYEEASRYFKVSPVFSVLPYKDISNEQGPLFG